MSEPVWVSRRILLQLHDEGLAEHGGAPGLRDAGLLDSALARPLNLHAYEGVTDPARLAAAYVAGIVRNHPFIDGNKRAAFAASGVFLGYNGWTLELSDEAAIAAVFDLAASTLSEDAFADLLRGHLQPRE